MRGLTTDMPRSAGGDALTVGRAEGEGPDRQTETVPYHFALDLRTIDGRLLGQAPIEPDWDPALETATFDAIRRGALPPLTTAPTGTIEPVWHTTLGRPHVSAFRVVVASAADSISAEIPTAYVKPLAQQAAARFVESGTLKTGELFHYRVCAFPADNAVAPVPSGFVVEEVPESLPLVNGSLQEFTVTAEPHGPPTSGEMPVFIGQAVLDEAVALSRKAGDVEVGGVLVGRLHRDVDVPEIFLEVTALIPALHTEAQATKVTFTAETWAAVDAALALRRRGEMKVGWFHFHPFWCRRCPPEKRANCSLSTAFFSAEDVHLHRACFSRAYHIALLISENSDSEFTASMFGWRQGMVMARAFGVRREDKQP